VTAAFDFDPATTAPPGPADDGPAPVSVLGRRWRLPAVDERLALAHCQRLGVPELLGRLLAGRGVPPEAAEAYLSPSLRTGLPDPSTLADMDRAAARLADAVEAGEWTVVFADYDVDGATSAALFIRYLKSVGLDPGLYVPDRASEGYGPNAAALRRLRQDGAGLAVLVDCGTTAFEALEAAADAGLEVVVIDHHAAETRLPPCAALVNPNRPDDASGLGELAACGVAFLALVALNRELRRRGLFLRRPEPDLRTLLDLVALGTVCDVVPVAGVNRVLVGQGLKVMARRGNPGLRALADLARVAERVSADHCGFALGPRINAGGRLGRSDLGARLLATDDPAEAEEIAALLDGHNEDRKAVESAIYAEAKAQAAAAGDAPIILASGEGWHSGVVGIVAGRLRERFHRPALVVGFAEGMGKGSGRSVPGVDLGAAILEARRAGLLAAGGGHPMAVGFSVEAGKLAALQTFLADRVARRPAAEAVPALQLDGALGVAGAGLDMADLIQRLGPFGPGNAEPRFAIAAAGVAWAEVVGSKHVRCVLTDGGRRLKAIAFRCLDTPLGAALLARDGAPVHLAGRLRRNGWMGREEAQFLIEDAAPGWLPLPVAD
jgi:single-stranded-DNA-specific exonuclease